MAFAGRSLLQQLVFEQRALQGALSDNLLQPAAGWAAITRQKQAYSTSNSSSSVRTALNWLLLLLLLLLLLHAWD
jgi:hypothetical protein